MFVDDVFLMLLFIKNTRDYLRGFIISSGGSRNDFLRRGVGISKTYFRYFCYTCKFLGVGGLRTIFIFNKICAHQINMVYAVLKFSPQNNI